MPTKAELRAMLATLNAPVTRVPTGVTALGLTNKQWTEQLRNPERIRAQTTDETIERKAEMDAQAAYERRFHRIQGEDL